jgi:hypothetical protein
LKKVPESELRVLQKRAAHMKRDPKDLEGFPFSILALLSAFFPLDFLAPVEYSKHMVSLS